jgi:hypothetical protein
LKLRLVYEFDVNLVFQGLLISDWEGIDRICEPQKPRGSDYRYCIAQSVNAGMDMVYGYLSVHMKCILQSSVGFAYIEQSTDYDTSQV